MTYVTEMTGDQLRAHMRRLQKMEGWRNPLDDRLFQEIERLDAIIAPLPAVEDEPAWYVLEDEDGDDTEFNTVDQFSYGRAGGTPLYTRPQPAAQVPDMACAVWDVFNGTEWFMAVVSPLGWDAKSVSDSLIEQHFAPHLHVMQRHLVCEGNPVTGLIAEVERLRAMLAAAPKPEGGAA